MKPYLDKYYNDPNVILVDNHTGIHSISQSSSYRCNVCDTTGPIEIFSTTSCKITAWRKTSGWQPMK